MEGHPEDALMRRSKRGEQDSSFYHPPLFGLDAKGLSLS
jgi:hypothetical protein